MAQLAGSSVVIKELEMSGSTDLPLVITITAMLHNI